MPTLFILSTTLITLALIFYSLGVWAERIARYLKPWHVAAFWTGFGFDLSGTWVMHKLSRGPFNLWEWHTLTGQLALWLMLAISSGQSSRREAGEKNLCKKNQRPRYHAPCRAHDTGKERGIQSRFGLCDQARRKKILLAQVVIRWVTHRAFLHPHLIHLPIYAKKIVPPVSMCPAGRIETGKRNGNFWSSSPAKPL